MVSYEVLAASMVPALLIVGVLLHLLHRRRVAAQLELAAREAHLELIGQQVDDLIYRIELQPRPRFVFVSRSSQRLIGYSPQEHYDDPELQRRIVHPADRDLLGTVTPRSGTDRLRWRHRDGHTVWFERHDWVHEVDGVPAEILGVARDVTHEELDRRGSRALQRMAAAVLVEKQSFAPSANSFATELAELLEASSLAIRWEETVEQGPIEHQATVPVDGVGTRVSGTAGPCSIIVELPEHAPSSEAIAPLLPAFAHTVDTLRVAAARDRELQRVLQALAATASAVMLTDADGHIEWINPAFTRITGYPESEAIGETPRLLKSGVQSEAYYEHMWATIRAGRPFADQLVDRRRDGTLYTAAVTIDPVLDQEGQIVGFIGVQKDVTAEETAREGLHRRELAVLRRQRDIEQERALLVQTISHELRTPLTVVTAAAATLHRDDLDPATRDRVREAMERATEQLLGRLDVLLAATDGVDGPPVRTDVGALVHGVLSRIGSRYDVARVRIEGRARWFGYAALAHIVLRCVLENALEYSLADGVVEVAVSRRQEGVRVVIIDHGAGVDGAFLGRIAQPFLQEHGESTREHGGLGLGLYAARRAVTRLDGSMDITSGPDGTRVVVELPDERTLEPQR
jgi:PAS domain S-box-containing protein